MNDRELLCEPTAEALDEWKLFVPQSTLDEVELNCSSNPKLLTDAIRVCELSSRLKLE